jgi:hypothetical protein
LLTKKITNIQRPKVHCAVEERERESRESNRDRASFTSWAEEASMGNAGSAPEQAKNAVDRAKAEARHMPPSTVRFVPVAADNQARGAACYDRWATALGTGLVEEETC